MASVYDNILEPWPDYDKGSIGCLLYFLNISNSPFTIWRPWWYSLVNNFTRQESGCFKGKLEKNAVFTLSTIPMSFCQKRSYFLLNCMISFFYLLSFDYLKLIWWKMEIYMCVLHLSYVISGPQIIVINAENMQIFHIKLTK